MQLRFEVGRDERHVVVFRFNKFWGNLSITVDDAIVVRDFRLVSVKLTKSYTFTVGVHERHAVRIDKTRAVAFAGLRPQPVNAYVDGILVAEGTA